MRRRITRTVLRVSLTLTAAFDWSTATRRHRAVLEWVEDTENEHIYKELACSR